MYIGLRVKSCQILINLDFVERISKNSQISNFMKIYPPTEKLFHVDGQSDRHDKANGCFFFNFVMHLKRL